MDSIPEDQSVVSSDDEEDGSLFFDTAEGPKISEKNESNKLNNHFNDIIKLIKKIVFNIEFY